MLKNETRMHTCCFTGHRPEKLIWSEQIIINVLEREIKQSVKEGFVNYITGMARGADIWAAEIIMKMKKEGDPIKLICAVPYNGFEMRWVIDWQLRYKTILKFADEIYYISPYYHMGCFQKRNKWMVDHSNRVIAVYNGEKGGTQNTILYAKKNLIQVKNVIDVLKIKK